MCLLDTHALIWFMFDDSNLSEKALNLITFDNIGALPHYVGATHYEIVTNG